MEELQAIASSSYPVLTENLLKTKLKFVFLVVDVQGRHEPIVIKATKSEHKITGLNGDSRYLIKVRYQFEREGGESDTLHGNWSDTVHFSTNPGGKLLLLIRNGEAFSQDIVIIIVYLP